MDSSLIVSASIDGEVPGVQNFGLLLPPPPANFMATVEGRSRC